MFKNNMKNKKADKNYKAEYRLQKNQIKIYFMLLFYIK